MKRRKYDSIPQSPGEDCLSLVGKKKVTENMLSMSFRTKLPALWVLLLLWSFSPSIMAKSKCNHGCPLALASYYMWLEANATFVAQLLNTNFEVLQSYNPASIPDQYRVQSFIRINVPFSCDCLNNGQFLGHIFQYNTQEPDDTYQKIAETYYANLTTVDLLENFNDFHGDSIPLNSIVNVPVNCSCGDDGVDKDYGLFLTYPLRPEENMSYVAQSTNSTPSLIQRYNPNVNVSAGTGIVFIPAKDKNGLYPTLTLSSGHSTRVIAGIFVGVAAGVVALLTLLYLVQLRRKNNKLHLEKRKGHSALSGHGHSSKTTRTLHDGKVGVTIDKSVEFSYKELAQATNNFSMSNMIGSGGFGNVYYAELGAEKVAIKKMDMEASREFIAELKVLTRVHHLNLVHLIGYCVEECLFLVYEFIDNGNLSEHLRGSGDAPLPWSTRVQIALESARGLHYIHEQTEHVYIHRDIKSANILIDKSFHAKVADFGLAKLTEVGNYRASSHLVGTFGYMPPEYAHHGVVSPKVDVYAFGVVLYELISAKEAVVKQNAADPEPKGLVGMFETALNHDDQNEIRNFVDPRLGDDEYPIDSVCKMAKLANVCTQESPDLRPSMKAVVVALLAMSSTTGEWDSSLFNKTQHVEL